MWGKTKMHEMAKLARENQEQHAKIKKYEACLQWYAKNSTQNKFAKEVLENAKTQK